MGYICGAISRSDTYLDLNKIFGLTDVSAKHIQAFWKEENIQLGIVDKKIAKTEDSSAILLLDGDVFFRKEHAYVQASDQEVLTLYLEKGTECFASLHGAFAIAIYDNKKKELYLACDQFGQKSLYWTSINDTFIFSRQLKGLLTSPSVVAYPDFESIAYYFAFGFIPSGRTPLEKVYKLPPASYLTCSKEGSVFTRAYWSLSEQLLQKNQRWNATTYHEIFKSVIRDQCNFPKTAFLIRSQGDKYALGNYLGQQIYPQIVPISFDQKENDKHRLNTGSINFQKLICELPMILWHLELPVADLSAFMFKQLCQYAVDNEFSSIVTSVGSFPYLSYHIQHPPLKYRKTNLWHRVFFRKLLTSSLAAKVHPNYIFHLLRKINSSTWNSFFLSAQFFNDPKLLKEKVFKGCLALNPFAFLHSLPKLEELGNSFSALLFMYFRIHLPNNDLLIEDTLTQSFGLKKTGLFLEQDLISNIASIPERSHQSRKDDFFLNDLIHPVENFKYKRELLPDDFIKQKQWLLSRFSGLLQGILVQSHLISPGMVHQLLSHANHPSNFRLLWSIYVMENWFQVFIERKNPGLKPEIKPVD